MIKSKVYFEKSALIVFLFSTLGSVLNFIFQFYSLKHLSVSDYGDLNSLLSITTVVGTIATIATIDAVRFTSNIWMNESFEIREKSEAIFRYSRSTACVFFIVISACSIVAILFRNRLSLAFNISRSMLIPLAVFTGTISVFPGVLAGILQGMQRFIAASVTNTIVFLTKLVFSILLYFLGLGVSGAFVSILVGYLFSFSISTALIMRTCRYNSFDSIKPFSVKHYLSSICSLLAIQLALSLVTNIDILVIKRYFDQDVTGIYSSAMVIGKASNYLISALVFVLLPVAAAGAGHNSDSEKVFLKALLYTGTISGLFAAVCSPLYLRFIVPILGTPYIPSKDYIFPIALLFIPISLITVVATYYIAQQKTKFVSAVILSGILLFFILSLSYHRSVQQILFIQTGIFSLVFIVLLTKYATESLKSRRRKYEL